MADIQSLNLVVMVGRVTGEIKLDKGKGKDKNTSLARFSIATNEKYQEFPTSVQYHNLSIWGKKADMCKKWLRKGSLVAVKGKLRHPRWTADDGSPRSMTVVNVDEITFLGKKEEFEEAPKEEEVKHEREPGEDPF